MEISELSQHVKQIIVDLLGCKTLKHGVSIERNIQKAKGRDRERERERTKQHKNITVALF